MATTTPNFGLRRPTNQDTVNVVTDIADNMTLIDAHAHAGTYVPLTGDATMTGRLRNSKATRDALHIDQLGTFTDQKAHVTLRTRDDAPSGGLTNGLFIYTDGRGDNATFIGNSAASFTASDSPTATAGNKGVLYGLSLHVRPLFERNNVPFDDATPLLIGNSGTARGTDALYFERNAALTQDFGQIIQIDSRSDHAIRSNGNHAGVALNFANATIGTALLTGPNNVPIQLENAAGSLLNALKMNASDLLDLYAGAVTISAAGTLTTTAVTLSGALTASSLTAPLANGWTGEPVGKESRYVMPAGTLLTSLDPSNAAVAASLGLLTSGTPRMVRGGFAVPTKVTNFNFVTGTQAAVSPTNWWGVITDAAGVVLAVTADQGTAAIAASTVKTVAFTAPTVIPAGPVYYGVMVAAGTVPTLAGLGSLFNAVTTGFVVRGGNSTTTGQTTPPAVAGSVGAPTSESASRPWFWLT